MLRCSPPVRAPTLELRLRPGAAYEVVLYGANRPLGRTALNPRGRGAQVSARVPLPGRARSHGVDRVWLRGEGGCVGSVE